MNTPIANHCLPPIPSRDLQSSSIPSASPVESSITRLANLPHPSQWNLPRQQKHLKGIIIPVESSDPFIPSLLQPSPPPSPRHRVIRILHRLRPDTLPPLTPGPVGRTSMSC
ncbi:unnamed protein product [Cuscuta campestris]|uniref:Uncharacterized protein n=1 Tax=Cuscuta campestris TaxID=132261 RepID=A0A484KVE3_9ASTE|nr:unnamed protein product [Cuscuta campestris]